MKTKMKTALFSAAAALALSAIGATEAKAQFSGGDLAERSIGGTTQSAQTSGGDPIAELTNAQRQIILLGRFLEIEKLQQQLAATRLARLKLEDEMESLGEDASLEPGERIQRKFQDMVANDPRMILPMIGVGVDNQGTMTPMGQSNQGDLFGLLGIQPTVKEPPQEQIVEAANPEPTPTPTPEATPDQQTMAPPELGIPLPPPGGPSPMGIFAEEEQDRGVPGVDAIRGVGSNLTAVVLFPSGGQYVMSERDEREGWLVRNITSRGVYACDQEKEDRKLACRNLPFGRPIMPEVPDMGGAFGAPSTAGFSGYGVPITTLGPAQ